MQLDARQKYQAIKMTSSEFERLVKGKWQPVKLEGKSIPTFLKNLPDDKVLAIYGSGSFAEQNPVADSNPDRGQIGGIDVYRKAEEQNGVDINKDWYAIYQDPDMPEQLYVLGPKQDAEHWINEIPDRLKLAFVDPDSFDEPMS